MGVPLYIASAADLVDKSIQKIFLKGSTDWQTKFYTEFMNVQSGITDYYEKDSSLSGLGYASRIVENAIINSDTPIQGFDKTYTQVQYGKMMPVTKMMWFFGIKKRDLTGVVQELVKACSDLRELRCAERLDNGWATSYTAYDDSGNYTVATTGGDSAALFTASHTREDGGSNINNIIYDGTTYNMDFDTDAIKAAHRTASLVMNPKGKKMNINIDTFLFSKGSTNYFKALEILGAIKRGYKSESTDRDGSGIPEFKVMSNPFLSNVDYYYAFDSSMKSDKYGLQFKESQPISLEGPNVVFKTGEIQYKATTMFDLGHNDARGIFGSTNLNA